MTLHGQGRPNPNLLSGAWTATPLSPDSACSATQSAVIPGSPTVGPPRVDRAAAGATVGVGRQRRALAGLEVHDVVTDRSPVQRQRRLARLLQQRDVHAERGVRALRPADRLEDQVDRCAVLDELDRRRHVREDAGLGGDLVPRPDVVEQVEQFAGDARRVGRGVDADDGVAAAEQQPVEDGGGHPAGVVGGVVGLQAGREPTGQAEGVAEPRHDLDPARHRDEVLVAHELADRGDHLGHQPRRDRREHRGGIGPRRGFQQPLPEATDREPRDGRERGAVEGVDDQPADLVGLVRHDQVVQERRQRDVGQRPLRRRPFRRRRCRAAGEVVTRARG